MAEISRPLDLLNASLNKDIIIELKNGNQISGTLKAFDIHINLVIDNAIELVEGNPRRRLGTSFIRGNYILWISPGKK